MPLASRSLLSTRPRVIETLGTGLLVGLALTVALGLLALLLSVVLDGITQVATLARLWALLTRVPREISAGGGIGPQIYNTVYLAVLSTAMSAPLGVAAAAWLARFARQGPWLGAVRVALDGLATLPSVVYGLFGFLVFAVALHLGFTLLGGALVLACMNLPLVVGVSEESIRAVPRALEDASLALGASRVQTLFGVTLPTAAPGLMSALILAVGRVFAESAPLLYTAGLTTDPRHPYALSPLHGGETLAVHLWYVNSNGIVPDKRLISAGAAAVLVILSILTTAFGRRLGQRVGV